MNAINSEEELSYYFARPNIRIWILTYTEEKEKGMYICINKEISEIRWIWSLHRERLYYEVYNPGYKEALKYIKSL